MGGQWLGVEGLLDVLAGDLINSKEAGACGVLSGEARDVIHERGRSRTALVSGRRRPGATRTSGRLETPGLAAADLWSFLQAVT